MPWNNVLPWSVTWIHAGAVAASTTGPWAVAAAGGGALGAWADGVPGTPVSAAVCGASSFGWSERLLSQVIRSTSTRTAAIAPMTNDLGMVRRGSAGSKTSVAFAAKRWPPISSRS